MQKFLSEIGAKVVIQWEGERKVSVAVKFSEDKEFNKDFQVEDGEDVTVDVLEFIKESGVVLSEEEVQWDVVQYFQNLKSFLAEK